jgi:hypothetical protein
MMIKKLKLICFIAIGFMSCKQENDKKAIIIERKRIDDSTTTIIYKYTINSQSKLDSQKIVNTIFPNDTINLINSDNKFVITP